MQNPFDTPAHRASEELAFEASRLLRAGKTEEAERKYEAAGHRELEVARAIDQPAKLRSIFAISATACFIHGRNWDMAACIAHEFLSRPKLLSPDGMRELENLLDQALRSRELTAILQGVDLVPLEVRLEGGQVGRGVAPTKLIQEREEVVEALLLRIAEWKAGWKFRDRGASALAASMEFYEAPALAASYGIRLFVGASGTGPPGVDWSPTQVVAAFLDLANRLTGGADTLSALVPDPKYATAFVRAFRDLAPDGSRLTSVTFTSGMSRQPAVSFNRATRFNLSRALARSEVQPVEVRGLLKVVNLSGPRRIVVHADDGAHQFRLRRGEHDDTIGPKLNRMVHVVGQRDMDTGNVYAMDVILDG